MTDDALKPWQQKPNINLPIRAAVALLKLGQAMGWYYPSFSQDKLLAKARKKTGLEDFGDPRFLEPLALRLAYLNRTRRFTPLGRVVAGNILLKPLINRLRLQDLLKRHPEIKEQKIQKPLFVVAFPRTGTTLLSQLLALDPVARPLLFWETVDPLPRGENIPRDQDPRISDAVNNVEQMRKLLPAMRKIHDIDPRGPEECAGLLANAFILPNFEEDHLAYKEWVEGLSHAQICAAYEEYKTQLQVLQWQHGGGHWVLKSPLHLNWLDALLSVFPDACVVQTHRDPKQVLPSICSLDAVMQNAACGEVDCHAVGRHLSAQLGRALNAGMAAREKHAPERVFDVQYTELVRDPVAVINAIYRHFDYPFTAVFEQKIHDYMQQNPQHKHGSHNYSLDDFGLSAEQIDLDFAGYRQRFQIPTH